MTLSERVKQRGLEIGFDLVGVAPADVWNDLEFARQWVEAGYGGEMHYLSNPKRHDPRTVLPSVQSVVCAALVYNSPLPYSTQTQPHQHSRGWISRYAWGTDYHDVMRARLERLRKGIEVLGPQVETRVYVDTGPVVERAFARYSGIGWMGKNTAIINQQKGSWFFLGVVLTNLLLAPDQPAADRCGSCTRCLDACPTGALAKPYMMDASRCIAYLTIELKGSIPEPLRPAVGANVFGCDICQDVCPWNSRRAEGTREPGRGGAATTDLPEFQPMEIDEPGSAELFYNSAVGDRDEATTNRRVSEKRNPPFPATPRHRFSLFNPPLRALASLTEHDFRRVFSRSPLKRAKYGGWLRNLCVAMGNSGNREFVPWLERAAQAAHPLVAEHARWALKVIGGS